MKRFAYINVQCRTDAGEVGTFLTDGKGKGDRRPISPVCDSLHDLWPWMRANGWTLDERDGGTFTPWRVSQTN